MTHEVIRLHRQTEKHIQLCGLLSLLSWYNLLGLFPDFCISSNIFQSLFCGTFSQRWYYHLPSSLCVAYPRPSSCFHRLCLCLHWQPWTNGKANLAFSQICAPLSESVKFPLMVEIFPLTWKYTNKQTMLGFTFRSVVVVTPANNKLAALAGLNWQ